MIWFGPAGTSESFETMGYKTLAQTADYLEKMGLNAYEYQCGRGVRVNDGTAKKLKSDFALKSFRMSLHAPYYISLSSVEEEKRTAAVQYILDSAIAADKLAADRIIVHSGSCAKITRAKALELARGSIRGCKEGKA